MTAQEFKATIAKKGGGVTLEGLKKPNDGKFSRACGKSILSFKHLLREH